MNMGPTERTGRLVWNPVFGMTPGIFVTGFIKAREEGHRSGHRGVDHESPQDGETGTGADGTKGRSVYR